MAGPVETLKSLAQVFSRYEGKIALAGGLAASIYRRKPRVTQDVDLALWTKDAESSKRCAEELLISLGRKVSVGFIPGLEKFSHTSAALLVGTIDEKDAAPIDILLPVLPWVKEAVVRAQANKITLGSVNVPTILPEDVIKAKLFSVSITPDRFQDIEDCLDILHNDSLKLNQNEVAEWCALNKVQIHPAVARYLVK